MKIFSILILAFLFVGCKKKPNEYRNQDQLALVKIFVDYRDNLFYEKNMRVDRAAFEKAIDDINSFVVSKNFKFSNFVVVVDEIGDFFDNTKVALKYDLFKEDLQSPEKNDRSIVFVDVMQKKDPRLKSYNSLKKGDTIIASGKFLTKYNDTTKVAFNGGLNDGFPMFDVMILGIKKK